jgi:beta-glucosidase
MLKFPKGFLWSTATASYQIEGGWNEDGKGESVWDRFAHTPGKVARGENGDTACDHYRRWAEDVALMKELGLTGYRFSISWPRVLPSGVGAVNEKGLGFYSRLVDGLLAAGVRPLVTLYHWDHPQALQFRGGWPNREMASWFADYAGLMAKRLGDRVRDWMTLNEPTSIVYGGHINGGNAPDLRDRRLGFAAAHNLNRAHGLAVKAIKAAGGKGARAGTALNLVSLEPVSESPADVAAAGRIDAKRNRLFLDAVCRAEYPPEVHAAVPELAEWVKPGDFDEIRAPLDFLGVNYYHHLKVKDAPRGSGGGKVSGDAQFAYGLAPSGESAEVLTLAEGLRRVLLRVHKDYGVRETIVTENGMSRPEDSPVDGRVDDSPRIEFLRAHLTAAHQAIQEGCNLTGFCVWSLLDNFEWASGFKPRFGLVHVDHATQKRTVKDSGLWYGRCAKANGLV